MGREQRIFLAATRQNDGKTMISVGLLTMLKQTNRSIGFIKPVGQKYVEVNGLKIDKDSFLAAKLLGIDDFHLKATNPIAVEEGFTERYLDGKFNPKGLIDSIKSAYAECARGKDIVIIEGTGHAGVGSVFDLNNAVVARILKAPVILVTTGGIGKPIDEIMLNKAVFDKEGVKLAGVIINKVMPEKMEKIRKYLIKGLNKHGIPLLGIIPYCESLMSCTMGQIKSALNLTVLHGTQYLDMVVKRRVVGAMFPHSALKYLKDCSLLITSGDREDLILSALNLAMSQNQGRTPSISGLILTGGIRPYPAIISLIRNAPVPVLLSKYDTYTVASRIHDLIVKIGDKDTHKIEIARCLAEKYVDLRKVLSPAQN